MFFNTAKHSEVVEANPSISFGEVASKISALWKAASDEDKVPYEEKAAADKERYLKEIEAYVPPEASTKGNVCTDVDSESHSESDSYTSDSSSTTLEAPKKKQKSSKISSSTTTTTTRKAAFGSQKNKVKSSNVPFPVGTEVLKRFQNPETSKLDLYKGKVVRIDDDDGSPYLIEYEDGDDEHLDYNDLLQICAYDIKEVTVKVSDSEYKIQLFTTTF